MNQSTKKPTSQQARPLKRKTTTTTAQSLAQCSAKQKTPCHSDDDVFDPFKRPLQLPSPPALPSPETLATSAELMRYRRSLLKLDLPSPMLRDQESKPHHHQQPQQPLCHEQQPPITKTTSSEPETSQLSPPQPHHTMMRLVVTRDSDLNDASAQRLSTLTVLQISNCRVELDKLSAVLRHTRNTLQELQCRNVTTRGKYLTTTAAAPFEMCQLKKLHLEGSPNSRHAESSQVVLATVLSHVVARSLGSLHATHLSSALNHRLGDLIDRELCRIIVVARHSLWGLLIDARHGCMEQLLMKQRGAFRRENKLRFFGVRKCDHGTLANLCSLITRHLSMLERLSIPSSLAVWLLPECLVTALNTISVLHITIEEEDDHAQLDLSVCRPNLTTLLLTTANRGLTISAGEYLNKRDLYSTTGSSTTRSTEKKKTIVSLVHPMFDISLRHLYADPATITLRHKTYCCPSSTAASSSTAAAAAPTLPQESIKQFETLRVL